MNDGRRYSRILTEWTCPPPVMPPVDAAKPPAYASLIMKPGYKTTEFWLSLGSSVLPWLTDAVPPQWKVAMTGLTAVGYAIARGLAKRN